MANELTYASPYPWDDEEMEASLTAADKKLASKPFVGSGFAFLRKQLAGPNTQLNDTAKTLMKALLQEHNVKLGEKDEEADSEVERLYGMNSNITAMQRTAAEPELPVDETLQMARDGKLSLFLTILQTVDTEPAPVSTKRLLRNGCLTVQPGDLPGSLDAKEFVLAALHFLSSSSRNSNYKKNNTPSSSSSSSNERFPSLPLIQPVQWTGDLEKRNYEKVGEWTLEDIQEKVNNLEQLFFRSPKTWRWLRREAFSPRLSNKDDETTFFWKGSIPASATAKRPKGGVKRKAPPSTSVAASAAPSEVVESSSTTPAVEATIVDDDEGDEDDDGAEDVSESVVSQ
eukprot:scaffold1663_cov210-Cylindrotheca_fusiformis.AAC.2